MKKIMFICTGNTCRSPMAEGFATHLINKYNMKYEICSRGLFVKEEMPANICAINALTKYNIDLKNHRSKNFNVKEVTENTIILTMTNGHKEYMLQNYPQLKSKVFTLKEYAGTKGDIYDPFGFEQDIYNKCAKEIYELINKIFLPQ